MKKFKSLLMLLVLSATSICSADYLFKEGVKAGEDKSNINLSSFVQVEGVIYNINQGEVFERDSTYREKKMKEVYVFNKDKLTLVFHVDKNDKEDLDNLEIENKKNEYAFFSGFTKVDGNQTTFKRGELENLKINASNISSSSPYVLMNSIVIYATYVKQIENKTAETELENFVAVSKIKSCSVKTEHKSCISCEFVDKSPKFTSCDTLYVNHILK